MPKKKVYNWNEDNSSFLDPRFPLCDHGVGSENRVKVGGTICQACKVKNRELWVQVHPKASIPPRWRG